MAGASLLTLIDDIASILDDVALMSKMAAKKTAGVLGDDLALNAQQVSGVNADRELPVVWAVAKGSLLNKAILVPLALAISTWANWAIIPLLMLGGLFLCYEGVEKLVHSFLHKKDHGAQQQTDVSKAAIPKAAELNVENIAQFEKEKIKGAIRTDFILSAEIIVISLGTVASATFVEQLSVLCIISLVMTIGVYGLVAGIVKLDDVGLHLIKKPQAGLQTIGRGLLAFAPYLMKALSVIGTAAMFLVGGGIISHGLPILHHWVENTADVAGDIPAFGQLFEAIVPTLINGLVGVLAGAIVVVILTMIKKVAGSFKSA